MALARYDRIVLDYESRRRSADGSLVVPGRFARTGLQSYEQHDGTARVEYRSREEVVASAPTYEGVTVTDLHPAGMVDASSWASVARGHVQGIHVVDGDDGEAWLEGVFYVKDGELADRIERGERPELSAGYYADEDPTPGEYKGRPYHARQTGIVANHVAAIPDGTARAGRGARLLLDSTGDQTPPGGGVEVDSMEDQGRLDAMTAERDQLRARLDSLEAEAAGLKRDLATAQDPARMDAAIKSRLALVDQARRLGGTEITGTDDEIRRRALEAVGVKLAADRSAAYVEARFDAELERISEDTMGEAIGAVVHDQRPATDPLAAVWAARDRYLDRVDREED